MAKDIELIEAVPYRAEADSFDFRRTWVGIVNACRSQRLAILLTTLLTLLTLYGYMKFWPPVYAANVKLYGESGKDNSRTDFYQNWAVFRSEQLNNEVEMINASPVLLEVIKRLHLKYDDVYHPFFSQLGYLWTESLPGKAWRGLKDFIWPPDYGPYYPTPEQADLARTLHDFQEGVKLVPVMETDIGNLQVMAPSPRVAEIANMVVKVYLEQRRARHVLEATTAYNALDEELVKSQKELDATENRMKDYYSQNKLLLVFEKDKVDIGVAEGLKSNVNDLQATIAGGEKALVQINSQLAQEDPNVIAQKVYIANPIRANLQASMTEHQVQRAQLLLHYRPDAPEVAEIDRQLAIDKAQLDAEPAEMLSSTTHGLNTTYQALLARRDQIRSDLATARAAMGVRNTSYLQARENLDNLPEKMQMVHDLDREHLALEKKYSAIQDKMMVAAVSRATAMSAPDSIHIVEFASLPSKPAWPNGKLLWPGALALGLIAGVGLALLLDLFFGRLHRYRLGVAGPYAMLRRDPDFAAALFLPREAEAQGGVPRRLRLDR